MMISGFQISTYKLYISLLLVVLTRLVASQFMLRRLRMLNFSYALTLQRLELQVCRLGFTLGLSGLDYTTGCSGPGIFSHKAQSINIKWTRA